MSFCENGRPFSPNENFCKALDGYAFPITQKLQQAMHELVAFDQRTLGTEF